MIIQLLLLGGFVAATLFAWRGTPTALSLATRRAALAASLGAAVTAVIAPGLVTAVAQAVGVGRGTDLVLYFFVLASVFVWIGLYRRLHDMEQRFVRLNRAIALERAADDVQGSDATTALEAPQPR